MKRCSSRSTRTQGTKKGKRGKGNRVKGRVNKRTGPWFLRRAFRKFETMARTTHNGNGHDPRHVTETPDVSHIKNLDVTHEASDVSVSGVAKFVGGLTVLGVVVFVLMWGMFRFLYAQETEKEPKPGPMAMTPSERLPPDPRLQAAPGFGVKLENGEWVNLENREPEAEYRVLREQWERQLKCEKKVRRGEERNLSHGACQSIRRWRKCWKLAFLQEKFRKTGPWRADDYGPFTNGSKFGTNDGEGEAMKEVADGRRQTADSSAGKSRRFVSPTVGCPGAFLPCCFLPPAHCLLPTLSSVRRRETRRSTVHDRMRRGLPVVCRKL